MRDKEGLYPWNCVVMSTPRGCRDTTGRGMDDRWTTILRGEPTVNCPAIILLTISAVSAEPNLKLEGYNLANGAWCRDGFPLLSSLRYKSSWQRYSFEYHDPVWHWWSISRLFLCRIPTIWLCQMTRLDEWNCPGHFEIVMDRRWWIIGGTTILQHTIICHPSRFPDRLFYKAWLSSQILRECYRLGYEPGHSQNLVYDVKTIRYWTARVSQ